MRYCLRLKGRWGVEYMSLAPTDKSATICCGNRFKTSAEALERSVAIPRERAEQFAEAYRTTPRYEEVIVVEAGELTRVCSWCKKGMGLKVGDPDQDGLISHGICEECADSLIGGGQGRSGKEVANSAKIVAFCVWAMIIIIACAIVYNSL